MQSLLSRPQVSGQARLPNVRPEVGPRITSTPFRCDACKVCFKNGLALGSRHAAWAAQKYKYQRPSRKAKCVKLRSEKTTCGSVRRQIRTPCKGCRGTCVDGLCPDRTCGTCGGTGFTTIIVHARNKSTGVGVDPSIETEDNYKHRHCSGYADFLYADAAPPCPPGSDASSSSSSSSSDSD